MTTKQEQPHNSRSKGIDISKAKYRDGAPDRGLGDTIARGIKTVTLGKVNPCPSCQKKIDRLNARFPYKQAKQK